MSPVAATSKSKARLEFFELLFGTDEGYLCIATTDPVAPKTSFHQRFFGWPHESIKVENYILKNEINKNLYFCVNLLSEMERKKRNCLATNLLWADLDEVDPSNIKIPPPVIIQSSPARWQAIWRLTTKLEPQDAERYSRRIAYALGADNSGWDLTQLLRIPFTKNFKYDSAPDIVLDRALATRAPVVVFEALPKPAETIVTTEIPVPDQDMSPEEIIGRYANNIDSQMFMTLYPNEPDDDQDWSKLLWHLIHLCFKAGMKSEEVFVIAQTSAVNKYARDGRPIEHLWKDVLKAAAEYQGFTVDRELLEMPELVSEPATDTFVDIYKDWATEVTDAIPEFHELGIFIALSAILSGSLKLKMKSKEVIRPNLWGLILGDSTVTRKTTAMRMITNLISSLSDDIIMASDASPEGLVSALSTRPNQVSLFYRDEISGMFDAMNRREYLSSMPEMLANLYDCPRIYTRILRKETIRAENPILVFFGGGVRDRVYASTSEEWILSGFLPRFLVVTGEFRKENYRDEEQLQDDTDDTKYNNILEFLADLYENYAKEVTGKIGGQAFTHAPSITVKFDQDAWELRSDIIRKLTFYGHDSLLPDTAQPTFDRLSRSIVKMAMILAATRQTPIDEVITINKNDMINATWYGQKWGRHSVDLILKAGKSTDEKQYDRILIKIKNQPGVSRGTLMQHMHLNKKGADDVLGTLEERGQIRKEKHGKGWRYWVT